MTDRRINLNFHQTFKPEVQYISAILNISNMNEYHTIKEISAMTGIPNGVSSGKVEPHIMYSYYMGLIEYDKKDGGFKLNRTPLGNVVFQEDPGLQEELTLLLCHCFITDNAKGADVWGKSFNTIFPKYNGEIKRDLFLKEHEYVFENKISKKILSPFLNSYDDMFLSLNLISFDENVIKIKKHLIKNEFVYLYAYTLLDKWDNCFPNNDEISSNELNELQYGKSFNWTENDSYKILEILSDKGIIRLNRQLMPFTILRLIKKSDLLSKLYIDLF